MQGTAVATAKPGLRNCHPPGRRGYATLKLCKPSGWRADFSGEVFSRIRASMGPTVLPFPKVSGHTIKKEADAGGVTAQAGCVEQGTAQRSPGKASGIHERWNRCAVQVWSAWSCAVRITRCFLDLRFSCRDRSHATRGARRWRWGVHPISSKAKGKER